ncbi:glutamate 5-kinase domain-containing protein [Cyclospora cayetanensis]|uniref:Glutamate 5-kinase domain-containing protein n=1 Tax=Cyclospora cayetanensis TaxID=88456 RepID=A0A1D3CYR7_9EIME|nr:glutamate 5-kinase domain-containing protein [Cyclospora cayetanensis]
MMEASAQGGSPRCKGRSSTKTAVAAGSDSVASSNALKSSTADSGMRHNYCSNATCMTAETCLDCQNCSSNSGGKPSANRRLLSPAGDLLRAFGRERLTVVIKVGTSTLMDERLHTPSFSLSNIGKLVDTICLLRSKGVSVLLVTSGAVGAGCVALHLQKRPEAIREKQALAACARSASGSAVGQPQRLSTAENLRQFQELPALSVGSACLSFSLQLSQHPRVVPILNENDSICTEELRFGDNDTLAAHCAVALEADFLFILTDVDCLYTKNPKAHADACPVWFVDRFTDVYSYLSLQGGGAERGDTFANDSLQQPPNPRLSLDSTGDVSGQETMDRAFHRTAAEASSCSKNSEMTGIYEQTQSAWRASGRSGVQGSLALNAQSSAPVSDLRVLPAQWCSSPPEPSAAALSTDLAADVAGAEHSPRRRLSSSLVVEAGVESESSCSSKKSVLEDDSPTAEADTNTGNLPVASPLNCTCTAEQLTGGVAPEIAPLPTPAATTTEATGNQLACAAVGFHKRWHRQGRPLQQQPIQHHNFPQQPPSYECCWPKQESIRFAIPSEEDSQGSPPSFEGTIFISNAPTGPSQSVRLVRRWILSLPVRGEVDVDVGCARSLVLHRKSLFAAGVKAVRGTFVAGECLSIFLHGYQSSSGVMGAEIGRCVTGFSSEELHVVKGHRSREFESLLGYAADQEVAHRHDLVLVYMNGDDRLRRICEGKESL